MKKFTFTLNRVQGLKEQILDEEKNKLAKLKKIEFEIENKIAEVEKELLQTAQELREERKNGITPPRLRSYDHHFVNLRNQLKQLHIDLEKAILDVDAQMEEVKLANQEVSKLEKLEEKQLEAYQKEVAKAEETFIEEFVSSDTIRKKIS